MLNPSAVRHGWIESVSLRHFQNCNTLRINHFRNFGVEDELELFYALYVVFQPDPLRFFAPME